MWGVGIRPALRKLVGGGSARQVRASSSASAAVVLTTAESRRMATARVYESALQALMSLGQDKVRPAGPYKARDDVNSRMDGYIKALDLEDTIRELSVIHVAGTKGKGSTCCFTESLLRHSGFRTGLFTSPHLIDIRERIRFNGKEVKKSLFNDHFWWCWDRLEREKSRGLEMPGFFKFTILLALRIFAEQGVDVAVVEVGLGGRLDCTNVIPSPAVCGIAALGFDHTEVLGETMEEIAGEKAGIFKHGVPAITCAQPEIGMRVLEARARELGIPLHVAPPLPSLLEEAVHVSQSGRSSQPVLSMAGHGEDGSGGCNGGGVSAGNCGSRREVPRVRLGLAGRHQEINAGLAVALCRKWMERAGQREHLESLESSLREGRLPDSFVAGLSEATWPGRAQIVHDSPYPLSLLKSSSQGGSRTLMTKDEVVIRGNRVSTGDGDGREVHGSSHAWASCNLTFYLDGAHSPESAEACAEWFCDEMDAIDRDKRGRCTEGDDGGSSLRILVFNCMSKRNPDKLFPPFLSVIDRRRLRFHRAIFVPPDSNTTTLRGTSSKTPEKAVDLSWQHHLKSRWEAAILPTLSPSPSRSRSPSRSPPSASLPQMSSEGGKVPETIVAETVVPLQGADPDADGSLTFPIQSNILSQSPHSSQSSQSSRSSSTIDDVNNQGTATVMTSVCETLEWLRQYASNHPHRHIRVLVTGSLYLVGDILHLLENSKKIEL